MEEPLQAIMPTNVSRYVYIHEVHVYVQNTHVHSPDILHTLGY